MPVPHHGPQTGVRDGAAVEIGDHVGAVRPDDVTLDGQWPQPGHGEQCGGIMGSHPEVDHPPFDDAAADAARTTLLDDGALSGVVH